MFFIIVGFVGSSFKAFSNDSKAFSYFFSLKNKIASFELLLLFIFFELFLKSSFLSNKSVFFGNIFKPSSINSINFLFPYFDWFNALEVFIHISGELLYSEYISYMAVN